MINCDKHGRQVSISMPDGPHCEVCRIEFAEKRSADFRKNEIRNNRKLTLEDKIHTLGVPKRYLNATCAPENKRWVLESAEKWRVTIINGPIGTGKTWEACGMLKHHVSLGGFGTYTTAMKMSQDIIRAGEQRYIDEGLLIIDEVGRQFETKQEKNRMLSVIDGRYQELKPMIFVGNFTMDQLKDQIGAAAIDRIRENHRFYTMNGESRRQSKS